MRSPTSQVFLWDLILRTLRAPGTTILFLSRYGHPSKTFNLWRAAAPRAVLCGVIPLMILQNILDGDLKCLNCLLGLVLLAFYKNSWKVILFLKRDPEKTSFSHLTT